MPITASNGATQNKIHSAWIRLCLCFVLAVSFCLLHYSQLNRFPFNQAATQHNAKMCAPPTNYGERKTKTATICCCYLFHCQIPSFLSHLLSFPFTVSALIQKRIGGPLEHGYAVAEPGIARQKRVLHVFSYHLISFHFIAALEPNEIWQMWGKRRRGERESSKHHARRETNMRLVRLKIRVEVAARGWGEWKTRYANT